MQWSNIIIGVFGCTWKPFPIRASIVNNTSSSYPIALKMLGKPLETLRKPLETLAETPGKSQPDALSTRPPAHINRHTHTQWTRRARKVLAYVNENYDVAGLCREFPDRLQSVKEGEGERLPK